MGFEQYDNFLVYLDRSVLAHYRASPNIYTLEEDDMGGSLKNIRDDMDGVNSWYEIQFGFRQLADHRICIAAFGPDVAKLSDKEKYIWYGHLLEKPKFLKQDPNFERWVKRNLEGSWDVEDGPIPTIHRNIRLIQALTRQTLGMSLFLYEWNPLIKYPIAENSEAYRDSHMELYRLLVDGIDPKVIILLANLVGVTLSDPGKVLNSFKELLPTQLVPIIHKPLIKCRNVRNKKHGISSDPIQVFPAFDTFQSDVSEIVNGLAALIPWLESNLTAKAESCLERESAMKVLFPKIIGPPRPVEKLADIKKAEGKTIGSIEFGEEAPNPDVHQSEAVIFHFTDGSAMTIRVGSNAGNLASAHKRLKPSDVSTSIDVFWAPAIDTVR